jgi:NADH-quinone oxidoreductase subunit C
MDQNTFLKHITSHFPDAVNDTAAIKDKRMTVDIKPSAILRIAGHLYRDLHYRFIIASAFHSKQGFEIMYHFSDDTSGHIVNLHVVLSQEKPEIESLANMFSGANWIEREMHELLGIIFLNHPEPEKLLSDGNWAEGVYPYRKTFK